MTNPKLKAALDFIEQCLAGTADAMNTPWDEALAHLAVIYEVHRPNAAVLNRTPEGEVRSKTQQVFLARVAEVCPTHEVQEWTDDDGQVCPAILYKEGRDVYTKEINSLLSVPRVRTRMMNDGHTFVVFCK